MPGVAAELCGDVVGFINGTSVVQGAHLKTPVML